MAKKKFVVKKIKKPSPRQLKEMLLAIYNINDSIRMLSDDVNDVECSSFLATHNTLKHITSYDLDELCDNIDVLKVSVDSLYHSVESFRTKHGKFFPEELEMGPQ